MRMSNVPVREEEDTVKKVVKRSSPSGNLESYLMDVKKFEEEETTTQRIFDMSDIETTTINQMLDMQKIDSSTKAISLPTLSLDPFVGPLDDTMIPVFVRYDDEQSTTTANLLTTQVDSDATTTTSAPSSVTTIEISTDRTATDQTADTDVMTSTISDKMFEEKISTTEATTTDIAKVTTTEAINETTEKFIPTTTYSPQPRELNLLNIPRSLSGSPIKPAIITTSPETVRATPSELSSILASLRDIVARFESFAMSSMKNAIESKSNDQNNRKRRSLIDPIKEIKQKTLSRSCIFDGRVFKVGEKISTIDDLCLDCTCEYAPIAHCIINRECP